LECISGFGIQIKNDGSTQICDPKQSAILELLPDGQILVESGNLLGSNLNFESLCNKAKINFKRDSPKKWQINSDFTISFYYKPE